jgi:3-dehydroquinate synthase
LPGEGYRQIVRTPETGGPGRERAAYDVLVAEGLLEQAGQRLRSAGLPAGRCAVITNPTLGAHHLPALTRALSAAGFEPVVCEIPEGEAHKTLTTVSAVYDRLAQARLARNEPVIALGGGVVGDLAGFVAATWLRGVPFVQIPTTLLSMVDASVGGKVAVDLPQGKNLVGAFKQPALVLIDPAVLHTLPAIEYRSGLAEVVKTAIIGDPVLFEQLAGSGPRSLVGMIADTVRIKAQIVERDPYETSDRAWLNLGHTFGHALELVSGYKLRHGEAVALGMVAATALSERLNLAERTLGTRVRSMIRRLGLRVQYDFDIHEARAAMNTDKKRRSQALRFVLPVRIGQVVVVDEVAEEAIVDALRAVHVEHAE